jgi:hypothetical protein
MSSLRTCEWGVSRHRNALCLPQPWVRVGVTGGVSQGIGMGWPDHKLASFPAKHPAWRHAKRPHLRPVDFLWQDSGLPWITPGELWTFCGCIKSREIAYRQPLAWALATGVEISHHRKRAPPGGHPGRTWNRGTGTSGGYPARRLIGRQDAEHELTASRWAIGRGPSISCVEGPSPCPGSVGRDPRRPPTAAAVGRESPS